MRRTIGPNTPEFVGKTAKNMPDPDWRRPPALADLQPIVDRLVLAYMSGSKPVSKILVRVPGPDRRFPGSVYKVVPRGHVPGQSVCGDSKLQPCTLDRLADASTLDGELLNDTAGWPFARPAERLAASLSINSGDIVLLANVVDQFQFGPGFKAQHGTLTSRDALVPVAFGYPRASGPKDTTMAPLLQLLQGNSLLTDPTEANALLQFLIR